jgi:hypothetical protein
MPGRDRQTAAKSVVFLKEISHFLCRLYDKAHGFLWFAYAAISKYSRRQYSRVRRAFAVLCRAAIIA